MIHCGLLVLLLAPSAAAETVNIPAAGLPDGVTLLASGQAFCIRGDVLYAIARDRPQQGQPLHSPFLCRVDLRKRRFDVLSQLPGGDALSVDVLAGRVAVITHHQQRSKKWLSVVDAENKQLDVKLAVEGSTITSAFLDTDHVVISGYFKNRQPREAVRVVRLDDGAIVKQIGGVRSGVAVRVGDQLYHGLSYPGGLWQVDVEKGKLVRKAGSESAWIYGLAHFADRLFARLLGDELVAYDLQTLKKTTLPGGAAPFAKNCRRLWYDPAEDRLYIQHKNRQLTCLDQQGRATKMAKLDKSVTRQPWFGIWNQQVVCQTAEGVKLVPVTPSKTIAE